MAIRRVVPLVLCVALLVWGCGGGEMSLTEYVERLNAIMDRANQQAEVGFSGRQAALLVAEGEQLDGFTPQDLQEALERVGEIETEVRESAAAIEPPEQVAALHDLLFDTRFASAREALAARAGTAADWEELSETPEMADYRAAVVMDKQACIEFQGELDATAQRGVFAEVAWIPAELKEVVEAALGCSSFPENPENLYRPLPTSTP
jgi:hypothetical protein